MKKKILSILLILGSLFLLSSCGSGWERTKKDMAADFGGGLPRHVRVYSFPKEEPIFEYTGKCYITDDSETSNIALICYDEYGQSKKIDFIGMSITIIAEEL